MWDAYFQSISSVLSNDKLGAKNIASKITVMKDLLVSGLDMLASINDAGWSADVPDVGVGGGRQPGHRPDQTLGTRA
jgi:hypothetical protein